MPTLLAAEVVATAGCLRRLPTYCVGRGSTDSTWEAQDVDVIPTTSSVFLQLVLNPVSPSGAKHPEVKAASNHWSFPRLIRDIDAEILPSFDGVPLRGWRSPNETMGSERCRLLVIS